MSQEREKYTEDFRKRAVALSHRNGLILRETAKSSGISASTVHHWQALYTETGALTDEAAADAENRRLRARIAELEEEADRLKRRQPASPNINAESWREI